MRKTINVCAVGCHDRETGQLTSNTSKRSVTINAVAQDNQNVHERYPLNRIDQEYTYGKHTEIM